MKKQQTAVEWLWEIAYNRDLTFEDWEQAKEMEKEQILHFAKLYDDDLSEGKIRSREELYNETFNK
jgi:hypothetical protein